MESREKSSRDTSHGPIKYIIRAYRKMDEAAGKKFFGNPSGLKKNMVGSIRRSGSVEPKLKTTNPVLYELKTKQFVNLNQPYHHSLIDHITSKYNQMIEDDKYSFVSNEVDGRVYMRHIYQAPKNFPELADLLTNKITNIVKNYYSNGYFSVLHLDCRRHYHVLPEVDPKLELFGLLWHCDTRPTDQLKLFIYLSDVTDKDGPFHAQTLQRTRDLMKMGFGLPWDYKLPIEVMEDPKYIVKVSGPRGTAFFANSNFLLHKAANPYPSHHRDVISISFEASKSPLSEDWLDHVKPIGAEEKEIKKRTNG